MTYTADELEGLDRLHANEKKKGWLWLKTPNDVDRLIK